MHRNVLGTAGSSHVDLHLSALGHFGYGVNACWPQTGVQNHFVENLLRRRLMWAETSIGTKEFLYVCVYKEKLESMFEQ